MIVNQSRDAGAQSRFPGRLPEPGRQAVLAAATRRTFAAGDMLVRQGESATALFIIESGRVVVRYDTPAGDSLLLSVMGPGQLFGELGLLNRRQERTASAQALDAVAVRVLRVEDFRRLRSQGDDIDDFVMTAMAAQIERLSRLVAEAFHVPAERRLARRLFEVAHAFADSQEELAGPVTIPLTQEDLASLAGTTRPTVNAALRRLADDGLVAAARGRVTVLDLPRLRTYCAW